MAEFFHAGRTNTDDCYDAGKHVHGSRRVYGHDDDAGRSRPAYAVVDDCCYNGELEVSGASAALKQEHKEEAANKESRAHDDHFCHHH